VRAEVQGKLESPAELRVTRQGAEFASVKVKVAGLTNPFSIGSLLPDVRDNLQQLPLHVMCLFGAMLIEDPNEWGDPRLEGLGCRKGVRRALFPDPERERPSVRFLAQFQGITDHRGTPFALLTVQHGSEADGRLRTFRFRFVIPEGSQQALGDPALVGHVLQGTGFLADHLFRDAERPVTEIVLDTFTTLP
jgi:hypothetical protein